MRIRMLPWTLAYVASFLAVLWCGVQVLLGVWFEDDRTRWWAPYALSMVLMFGVRGVWLDVAARWAADPED